MSKQEQLVQWARSELGSPYVFGAAGQKCTPAYRESVMRGKPTYADAIQRNCPVLTGRQSTCDGCKYNSRRAYDCRGLTREGIRAVTGKPIMGAGATSQWKDDTNWQERGPIQQAPRGVFIVFIQRGSVMSHTGISTGNTVIHASGHNTGVIESAYPGKFTHYAVPVGFNEKEEPMPNDAMLRVGSKGELVRALQRSLVTLGYRLPKYGPDGSFGLETVSAVTEFQRKNGLPATGEWGEVDQAALNRLMVEDIGPTEEDHIRYLTEMRELVTRMGELLTLLGER